MIKVAGNRRAVILFARIFFVWSLIGVAADSRAMADDVPSYQYTMTFGWLDSQSGFHLNMELRFVTHGLLGDSTVNIDPNDVQVLEAPVAGQPSGSFVASHLIGLTADDATYQAHFYNGLNTTAGSFERDDNYGLFYANAITAPGDYIPVMAQLVDTTHGTGQFLGESYTEYNDHNGIVCNVTCDPTGVEIDGLSIVATPEPNTGFLVGACFLLTVAVALRRKIPSYLRTIPRIP
jgi:hypothetical protein